MAIEAEALLARLEAAVTEIHGHITTPEGMAAWNRLNDADFALRSALAEDTARAAEGWPSIDSAPQNGAPVWGICMEAQTPKPKITWWANGWHTVSAAEKFVPAGPHKWWPTHWAPLAAPTRLPLKETADANR